MMTGDTVQMVEDLLTQGGVLMAQQMRKSFLEKADERTIWTLPALVTYFDTIIDRVDPDHRFRVAEERLQ